MDILKYEQIVFYLHLQTSVIGADSFKSYLPDFIISRQFSVSIYPMHYCFYVIQFNNPV